MDHLNAKRIPVTPITQRWSYFLVMTMVYYPCPHGMFFLCLLVYWQKETKVTRGWV